MDIYMLCSNIHSHSRSHTVTSDMDISETAKAAEFFCSDGVIITGKETGMAADIGDIDQVGATVGLPVIVGSGVTDENVKSYASRVDAMIIGSHFKEDGRWYNDVHMQRVKQFMRKWAAPWACVGFVGSTLQSVFDA